MFFINMTYLYLLYHSQHWIPCISSLVVGVEYMHIVHYINIHRYTGSTYISTPAVWQQKTRFTKSYQVQMLKKKYLSTSQIHPKVLLHISGPAESSCWPNPHLPGHFGSHRSIERVTRVWTVRHLGRRIHSYSQLI